MSFCFVFHNTLGLHICVYVSCSIKQWIICIDSCHNTFKDIVRGDNFIEEHKLLWDYIILYITYSACEKSCLNTIVSISLPISWYLIGLFSVLQFCICQNWVLVFGLFRSCLSKLSFFGFLFTTSAVDTHKQHDSYIYYYIYGS